MILRQLWRISSPSNPGNRLNTGYRLPHRVQMRMLNPIPENQVDPEALLPTVQTTRSMNAIPIDR